MLKKNLAHSYQKTNCETFDEPLNLMRECFWSTLEQKHDGQWHIMRANGIIEIYNSTGKILTGF